MQPQLFSDRPRVGLTSLDDETRTLAARLPSSVHLGTSSWTFPGWAGLVWDRAVPEEVLVKDGLSAYATHPLYRTVGVDRTFWAPVQEDVLQEWAQAVPDGFRFLIKAHEHLTWARFPHLTRYGRRRGQDNDRFLNATYARDAVVGPLMAGLGDRLGPIVFQLPPQPGLRAEVLVDGLERFLGGLPPGPLYAVEIRSPELLVPAYGDVLRAAGAVHCLTVHPGLPDLRTQWRLGRVSEGPAVVVRWNLAPGWAYEQAKEAWAPFDALCEPDLERRDQIARAVAWAAAKGLPSWVIANNKAEGSAPLTLQKLAERVVETHGALSGELNKPAGRSDIASTITDLAQRCRRNRPHHGRCRPYPGDIVFPSPEADMGVASMDTEAEWRHWLEPLGEALPLDEALHRVALDEGATCSLAEVHQQLDELAEGLPSDLDLELAVPLLIHRLFVEEGFRGDTVDYDHPDNSRLDLVLERKRGLPILLSAVTLEVARRVSLPLTGVGFPGHFLVGTTREPRLFLDPFHGGKTYRAADLARQLEASSPSVTPPELQHALAPTGPRDLLLRVSTNLVGSWFRRGEPYRALQNASRRVALRPEQPELLRDRGWLRAQLGQPELAAFDLATYLEARPGAPDASRIRSVLSSLPLGSA